VIEKIKIRVIDYLRCFIVKYDASMAEKLTEKSGYANLAPRDDVDENKTYCNLLRWAILNKDIKNLAITGPYGSGKSSLIRTFQKNYPQYKHLNISVLSLSESASESDEVDSESSSKTSGTEKIEETILLQLFYRFNNSQTPFSRFTKIKHITPKLLWCYSCLVLVAICTIIIFTFPKLLDNIVTIKSSLTSLNLGWFGLVSFAFAIISTLLVILVSIKQLIIFFSKNSCPASIQIPKAANISFDSEKTVFNKHLDEIVYYFELLKYDTVIIEDVDRFNNLKILVKLRELNTLLNNSSQNRKKILFIYALKDDMFSDKTDRTKFFDFIIPIVPVVHSSNTCNIFIDKFTKHEIPISEEFINSVSLYINEYRTLHNIFNEFLVYKTILGRDVDLNINKLFGMIVYKNMYPLDFAALQVNSGFIYEIFHCKDKFAKLKISSLEERIHTNEKELREIENEYIINTKELQIIYLLHFFGYPSFGNVNDQLELDGSSIPLKDIIQNAPMIFDKLKDNNRSRIRVYRQVHQIWMDLKVIDFLTAQGTKPNYWDRVALIEKTKLNLQEELKSELNKLYKEINLVRALPLKDLIDNADTCGILTNIKNEPLLIYLIRNGYIDEMYASYISYFYPGSLSQSDLNYLMSVKNRISKEYTYSLSKIKEIIQRMNSSDFSTEVFLNFDLVDHIILNKAQYELYCELIINFFKNGTPEAMDFLEKFIVSGGYSNQIIHVLCKNWSLFWIEVESRAQYTSFAKNAFFNAIIVHADIEDIKTININNQFRNYMANQPELLKQILPEHSQKFKELLSQLNVQFSYLDAPANSETESELFSYVYQNNLYELNLRMVEVILATQNTNNISTDLLKTANLTLIKSTNCSQLINYIEDNPEIYLNNIFFQLENNVHENESTIVQLLNDEKISTESKMKIIKQIETNISDISQVSDNQLWSCILSEKKADIVWKNAILYYQSIGALDKVLIDFLNQNCLILSEEPLENNDEFPEKLVSDIVECQNLDTNCYESIIPILPYYYPLSAESSIPRSKIDTLITNNSIRLSPESIQILKNKYPGCHIDLIVANIADYIESEKDFQLDANDYYHLLIHTSLTQEQKETIAKNLQPTLISDENRLAPTFFLILTESTAPMQITPEMFYILIDSQILSIEEKLTIIKLSAHIPTDIVVNALIKLEQPYADIINQNIKTKLPRNIINGTLLVDLKNRGVISSYKATGKHFLINYKMNQS